MHQFLANKRELGAKYQDNEKKLQVHFGSLQSSPPQSLQRSLPPKPSSHRRSKSLGGKNSLKPHPGTQWAAPLVAQANFVLTSGGNQNQTLVVLPCDSNSAGTQDATAVTS